MGLIQKPYIGILPNKNHPLSQGLVCCWANNEGTGGKVFDLSGNDNHGTITGADWVADGLDFIAANSDEVKKSTIFTSAEYDNGYTIITKIKADALPATTGILSIQGAVNDGTPNMIIGSNNGNIRAFTYGTWTAAVPANTGQFYEIAYSYEGNINKKCNLYIDGIYQNSATGAGSQLPGYGNILWLGNGYNNYYDGTISYIYIYNHALSVDEIAWLYRDPYAMFQYPSLVEFFTDTGAPPATYIPALMNYYRQLRVR